MKKLTSVLLALALALSLAACGGAASGTTASSAASGEAVSEAASSEEAKELSTTDALRIAGLKGPTTMGLVNLLSMEEDGAASMDYDLQLYGAADEIVPLLMKGELDMAAIPANLAATLYQKTEGGIQAVAVNTLGVLYVVEKGGDTVQSMADLKGRTILSTGKGTTPEYVLRYLLTQNGIDPDKDVTIEYYSEATEVTAQMANTEDAIAVLPQPYVTAAGLQADPLRVALDLTEEWNKGADTQLHGRDRGAQGVCRGTPGRGGCIPDRLRQERGSCQYRSGRHRCFVRGAGRCGQGCDRKEGSARVQHRMPDRRRAQDQRIRLSAGAV